jgi:hypothetical protein
MLAKIVRGHHHSSTAGTGSPEGSWPFDSVARVSQLETIDGEFHGYGKEHTSDNRKISSASKPSQFQFKTNRCQCVKIMVPGP